jgi:hypothetical protein
VVAMVRAMVGVFLKQLTALSNLVTVANSSGHGGSVVSRKSTNFFLLVKKTDGFSMSSPSPN